MKHSFRRLTGIALAAGLLLSFAAPCLPQSMTSIVVYAGANDFSWSTYDKKDASWWNGSEAITLADDIVKYQLSDGGWRKDMKTESSGSWNKSTIDNNATWGQIRYLARIYNATGIEKYKTSCVKGIDLLINGQYDNGGWPQVFNDAGTYHAHITFNDTAMVAVLRIMQEIANGSGDFSFIDSIHRQKAENSVNKGIECFLDCQITVNGKLTAWCQQHDEKTLAPAGARAYELPSICTSESVGIVDFLRTIPNPDARVIKSINAAVRWFDSVKIEGIKFVAQGDDKVVIQDSSASPLWARFYDLENSKPMFSDRDGKAYDDVSKISKERRTGYAWYGNWPANNVKLGTLPESTVTPPETSEGNHLYVGYSTQSANYNTIQAAVDAAALINPKSEKERVYIHIAPGVYREQVIVSTPYISFVNDIPSKEVKLTWYYGIGYQYYSMGSDGYYDAANAKSKSAKGEANRWGSTVGLKGSADYFRAESITFENSFNRYVTDEEIADGVEPSGSQSITFARKKGVDVTSKTATERAAAIAVEGDYSEFYDCTFLGSQDTLFTKCEHGYFRECHIEGNTDYIFGQGDVIFQSCELEFAGYSDKAVGGYITAKTNTGKYLFYDCAVSADSTLKVGSGYFGRPWGSDADVAFVQTKLQYADIITSAGWAKMSNNEPANANFKEYNTTANGNAVNTTGRVQNTVKTSSSGLDVDTYLNGWVPFYLKYTAGSEDPVVIEPISGNLITNLTPYENALPQLWKIDTDLQNGDAIYTDRDGVTYAELPDSLIGAEAIVTPCDAKKLESDLAVFTVSADVTAYVAVDSRMTSVPSWLSGWSASGLTVKNSQDVLYNLYSKDMKSGEQLVLGSNEQASGCTGYTVLVTYTAVQTIIPGDVNANQQVDSFDLNNMRQYLLGKYNLDTKAIQRADVNGDGTVNAQDVQRLQDWLLGKNVELVVQTQTPDAPVVTNIYENADFVFSGNIYIVGDSSVCNYDETAQKNQNRCGWGMTLGQEYNGVAVTNLARAGRSSRSFQNDTEYETMCNSIGNGDYLFVQFGHNDEKTTDAERGTYPGLDFSTLDKDGKNASGQYSYEWTILNKYVKIAQAKGATVVLVTPVTRRGSDGTANYKSHTAYAEGLVALGKQYNIPVIDMTTQTTQLYTELYNQGGADATAELHCYADDTRTTIDNTHLSVKGCTLIAGMIAEETGNLNLKISEKMK